MRRHLALSLVLLLAAAGNAFAGAEARLTGKILDAATKAPVANAAVKVEAVEGKTVKLDAKVKNDGSFALFLLDSTIKYKYTVTAPGYDPYEEVIKLKIGENTSRDFLLYKAGTSPGGAAPAGGGTIKAAPPAADPAVVAYNEGAALANAGDYAGAIAKFESAVAAKPNLTAGWIALAKTQKSQKNWPKAVEGREQGPRSRRHGHGHALDPRAGLHRHGRQGQGGGRAGEAAEGRVGAVQRRREAHQRRQGCRCGEAAQAGRGTDGSFAQAHYELA
jgi:tetratricopeptide (TPR) repeat protein